mmetsp:Transcript_37446/g.86480  ORF Transcript_37446/g.86480 Transcript_37446/m.86480 type:complete len:210 (-) Transcript_37446:704-1333(-)
MSSLQVFCRRIRLRCTIADTTAPQRTMDCSLHVSLNVSDSSTSCTSKTHPTRLASTRTCHTEKGIMKPFTDQETRLRTLPSPMDVSIAMCKGSSSNGSMSWSKNWVSFRTWIRKDRPSNAGWPVASNFITTLRALSRIQCFALVVTSTPSSPSLTSSICAGMPITCGSIRKKMVASSRTSGIISQFTVACWHKVFCSSTCILSHTLSHS